MIILLMNLGFLNFAWIGLELMCRLTNIGLEVMILDYQLRLHDDVMMSGVFDNFKVG